jgi:uroporphyrinogen-III decarboxylase
LKPILLKQRKSRETKGDPMVNLTSRDRMLRTIGHQDVDHIPCSFMSFAILRKRLAEDRYAVAKAEQEMKLDPMLFIPTASRQSRIDHPDLRGLPLNISTEVKIREWREEDRAGRRSVLCKEYETPAGKLDTSVRLSEDWPHEDHIPFIDDYQVPRVIKPLISKPEELEQLEDFLLPPSKEQTETFLQEAEQAKNFSREQGILLAGGWGVGMDMANWLCGMEPLMILMMQQEEFVGQLLSRIHDWNKQRMEVVLSAPVDLYIRRAWYEGCDFVTPRFYKKYLLPLLKQEVELAHERGAKFGYICSSGTKPMLDAYLEAGLDVLIGIDPVQGTHTDMPLMKQKLGNRVCLWGGVSGAVTLEQSVEEEVRNAVQTAIQILAPKGFILSPVDNLTVDTPLTWQNISIFIDEWQKHC